MDEKKLVSPVVEIPGAVDLQEWTELGTRLVVVNVEKFTELLEAMRKIVDAQELLAQFDWQLFLRNRPNKRYQA